MAATDGRRPAAFLEDACSRSIGNGRLGLTCGKVALDINLQCGDSISLPSRLCRGSLRMELQPDYRRAVGTDVWHWNSNCPKWPQHSFECSRTSPKTGIRCQECAGAR